MRLINPILFVFCRDADFSAAPSPLCLAGQCAEMMEDRGAKACELELWDLYAEEIVHVSHTLVVRAAVLVMRGNNQAKKYQAVERIGLPIEKLIVGIIPSTPPHACPHPLFAFSCSAA